jgi:uncharacterized protein
MRLSSNNLKLLIASDLHASNSCFRKLVSLALEIKVDAVLVAGDFAGKECRILVEKGEHFVCAGNKGETINLEAENVKAFREELGDKGIYSVLVREEVYSERESAVLISRARRKRLQSWCDYAGSVFREEGIRLIVIPGNEDGDDILSVLDQHSFVENVDESVVDLSDFKIGGLGYSNQTPWDTPRELNEDEIRVRLDRLRSALGPPEKSIALIHVPPLASGLDWAPELIRRDDGELDFVPGGQTTVGSLEVRNFIEGYQPLMVVSGHCHDSQGFRRIGPSFCVNPGSSYQTGTLLASLVVLEKSKIKGFQSLVR